MWLYCVFIYSTAIKDKKIKKYRSKKNKKDSSMCLLKMQLFDSDSKLDLFKVKNLIFLTHLTCEF